MSTTEVEIFGSVYHVRGGDDDSHLHELAAKVDRVMRDIADQVATVDTAKIAILAALNLAAELAAGRGVDGAAGNDGTIEAAIRTKVEALTIQLDAALSPETASPEDDAA